MNKSITALLSSCCLCLAILTPQDASASPPSVDAQTSVRTVRLEVDTTNAPEEAHGLENTIRETLTPKLEEANYQVTDEGSTTLRVRLRALESGEAYDYGLHFEFVDGDTVTAAIEWVDCHVCADARLLKVLEGRAPALIQALDQRTQQPEIADDPGEDNEGNGNNSSDSDKIAPLGPLGGVGIGVAALGIGGLVWGGIDVGRGKVYDQAPGDFYDRSGTNHAPRGSALIGVGATLAAGGLIMLGVDLARRAKKRKQSQSNQALVVPLISPTGVGVSGRF